MHRLTFTVATTIASRAIRYRDRAMRRVARLSRAATDDVIVSQHWISSGNNRLHAAYVEPAAAPAKAALLICHGIGEIVEYWFPVQHLLAANGVASLVFDYSGYGRSSGSIDWRQCELDAVNAFEYLKHIAPSTPISMLGLSMGSGVAAAVIDKVMPQCLFLCGSFTSYRAAACAVFLPRFLSGIVPPIWNSRETLKNCLVPVIIVHGEKDPLFPVQMAADLASACGANAELIVVPNLSHNEPFYKPRLSYWNLIISRL
ncbi:MAG: alpha/beta fold hydrolase [Terracidiphilus sp.]